INPGKLDPWSISNFQIFPNFVILVYERGWYLTYQYWPTSHNTHQWEMSYYFPPSRTASERIRHEVTAVVSKEAGLQDAGTLDGTQLGLESRAITSYPLSDQEITVRHLHKVVGDWVHSYLGESAGARR
nr:SRPBCC family protein [Micromonospora sp. DSM 115978]